MTLTFCLERLPSGLVKDEVPTLKTIRFAFISMLLSNTIYFEFNESEAGSKVLASQLFLDCRARRSG